MRRPRSRSNRKPRPNERRKPPEDATGAERGFLDEQARSGVRVRFELVDGSCTVGVVRSFNETMIAVQGDDGPERLLPKTGIRYLEELD